MTNPSDINPKVIKLVGVFIVFFFILVIAFNLWMKSSMEKSGLMVPVTTTVAEKSDIKKPSIKTKPGIPEQEAEKQYEGQSSTERRLLLQ